MYMLCPTQGGRLIICCSTQFLDHLIKQQHMQNEHGMQVESSQLTCDDAAWQRR